MVGVRIMSTWEETGKEQIYYSIHKGWQFLSVISFIFEHLLYWIRSEPLCFVYVFALYTMLPVT